MREYNGIPVWEESAIGTDYANNIFRFEDGRSIVIPAETGYALIVKGEEWIGVLVSKNGEPGFIKSQAEKAFVRTCPTFIGGAHRSWRSIEARVN